MTHRKLQALRNLAARPSTEAEGKLAREMLAKAEAEFARQSPKSATLASHFVWSKEVWSKEEDTGAFTEADLDEFLRNGGFLDADLEEFRRLSMEAAAEVQRAFDRAMENAARSIRDAEAAIRRAQAKDRDGTE